MKSTKKKRMKIAALTAAVMMTAFAPGCAFRKSIEPKEVQSGSSSVSDESAADRTGLIPGQPESADGQSGQGGQGGKGVHKTNITATGYIRRLEAEGRETEGDIFAMPSDVGELHLLLSDYTVTDYDAAAARYRELGGNIRVERTYHNDLFDSLTAGRLAGRPVDLAQFDNGMMFPYGVAHGLIEPIEKAVDLSADRWLGYRDMSELFAMNNWHYVLCFGTHAETVLYYNKETMRSNGYADPWELYQNDQWSTEKLAEMLRSWRSKGADCTIAGNNFERGMLFGSGQTMIIYNKPSAGFSGNYYSGAIYDVQRVLFSLKNDDIIGWTDKNTLESALNGGVLFWSGSYFDGAYLADTSNIGAVPFPSFYADKRCRSIEADGLVMVKNCENRAAAGVFLECAREQSHEPSGAFAEQVTAGRKLLYEYGMGISPAMSLSESRQNTGYDKAIIPLFYAGDPGYGEWEAQMFYFSYAIHPALSDLNKAVAKALYGSDS